MGWHIYLLVMILTGLVGQATLEGQRVRWKKRVHKPPQDIQLFHSTIVANLPTTETLRKGNFEFIVSHRFIPDLSSGFDSFWGVDGPAYNRLSLAYALTHHLMVEIGRSNRLRNIDLSVKSKLWQRAHPGLPLVMGARAGIAFSPLDPRAYRRNRWDVRNFQFFGQLLFNTLIQKKVGIGLVPAYLHNSDLLGDRSLSSVTMGAYLQVYVSPSWNIWAEAAPVVSGYRDGEMPFTAGIEFETGGHFFKIFLTNSTRLNTSQFLAGSGATGWDPGKWHLGFSITRLLRFGEKW